ncbi:MAG TPA: hypothetical protein PKE11_14740, partial [Accumulibacter sp.]|uniref:hypothetical protein n=1 Tax=Accumulibacter sp. TaxID=2053492 RepID=UPI002BB4617A
PEPSKSEERPANWRTALREARQVANSLGIPWRGKPLAKIVEEIDRRAAKTKEADTPEDKAAEKPVDASAFVKSPDGSIDFGEITPEMAASMKRQVLRLPLP